MRMVGIMPSSSLTINFIRPMEGKSGWHVQLEGVLTDEEAVQLINRSVIGQIKITMN